ncbi:MAG: DUF2892 domain-containing protein [Pseudomonadota bacterium]
MTLTKNVGTIDKVLRVVAGIALLAFAFFGPADMAWKWLGLIGIVPLATAFMGSCPAYSILGVRTSKADAAS